MHKKGELSVKKHPDGSEEITGKIYEGLIMAPDMLMGYKELDPELPKIILKLNMQEMDHRRDCEKKFIEYSFIMSLISNISSLVVSGLILYVASLFMTKGFAWEGMWIALSIAGVIGIFIIKRYITGNNKDKPVQPGSY